MNCNLDDPCNLESLTKKENRKIIEFKSSWSSYIPDIITSLIGGIVVAYILNIVSMFFGGEYISVRLLYFIISPIFILYLIRKWRNESNKYKEWAFTSARDNLLREQGYWIEVENKKIGNLSLQGLFYMDFVEASLKYNDLCKCISIHKLSHKSENIVLDCLRKYSENSFSSSLKNIILNDDEKCEISFKDGLEQISHLRQDFDKNKLHNALFLITKVGKKDRDNYALSLGNWLSESYCKWYNQSGKSIYIDRLKKFPCSVF